MGLWSRIKSWFASDRSDDDAWEEPRGTADAWMNDPELPPGWHFDSLYHYGTGITKNTDPSDSDISGADSILVRYTDDTGTDYRWIHGATSRRAIGHLIATVTVPDSPVR